jgi:signal transduction histidine kinase
MHALLFELRPESLEEEGLVAALRKYAAAAHTRDGVAVEVAVEGERPLPPAVEEAAYRIAREALHNVAKHAHASRARVALEFRAGHLWLQIRDDGRGFDPSERARAGVGLSSMRERAEQLGGSLTLDSAPGAGTSLCAELPFQES